MKLTKSKLKQIIKEELTKALSENTQFFPEADPEVNEIYARVVKWTGVKNETSINGPNPDDTLNTIAYYVSDLIRTGGVIVSAHRGAMEGLLSNLYLKGDKTRLEDIKKKMDFIKKAAVLNHDRAPEALTDIEYATNYFKKKAAEAL
tara:strand:+ start:56 stop:496 length:441 start_codon:yes stop_codon:yes gene_type:complete